MSGQIDNYYIIPTDETNCYTEMDSIQEVRDYIQEHPNFDEYNIYHKRLGTLYTPNNEVVWYTIDANENGLIKLDL